MKLKSWMMGTTLVLYFAELVFPPITVFANSGWICVLCFFLWLILSISQDSTFYRYVTPKMLVPLVFYFSTAFLPYLFGNSVIAHRYMALALVPLGYLIYTFYETHGQRIILKNIMKIVLLLSTITLVFTTSALLANPYVSRSIKSSGEVSSHLAEKGIGGYSFIYFIAIITVVLIHIAVVEKCKWKKVCFIVLSVLCVFLILKSNYMIALLVLLAELLVYMFIKAKRELRRNSLIFLAFLCGISIAIYLMVAFQDKIMNFLPPRVVQIFSAGNSNAITSIMSEFTVDRFPRLQESAESFMKYPIAGIIGQGTLSYEAGYLTGFGQHSYIFDTFALYGLFLGICAIYSCTIPFHSKERCTGDYRELTWAVFVGAILIYFLNNATESIGLAVGVVYPFVRDAYRLEDSNE